LLDDEAELYVCIYMDLKKTSADGFKKNVSKEKIYISE
jgi:hypothetical protein